MVGLHHSIVGNLQATHPVMMTNGLPNPALMGNFPPSSHQMHKPPPWSGGSAAGSSGPPSFSSHLQSQMTSLGSPNDVGLLQPSSVAASGQAQQPPKPLVSPGPPPPPPAPPVPPQNDSSKSDFQYNGTELVMLYDYKVSFSIWMCDLVIWHFVLLLQAQAPDDLTVKRGDWVYADLNNQTVDGWLWSYAPKTRKYGFIPRAYAKPPAMTSL